jgi:hypothetical protein
MKVKIQITDLRGKYATKVYEVEVDPTSPEFLWYGAPLKQFISDNNHPPYKPGTRSSVYYSRFRAAVVKN